MKSKKPVSYTHLNIMKLNRRLQIFSMSVVNLLEPSLKLKPHSLKEQLLSLIHISSKMGISKPEADVLLFLSNNSELNRGCDMVEIRGFSKAYEMCIRDRSKTLLNVTILNFNVSFSFD